MELTAFQALSLLMGTGILGTIVSLLWKISKRDFQINLTAQELVDSKARVSTLEEKLKTKIGASEEKVNTMEKEFIEIKANQKNLIHSIDTQNKQVLDLIERLEKNHEGFINSQKVINEKLEASIEAIKNTFINSGHSSCIFYKKTVKDIKDIIGVEKP